MNSFVRSKNEGTPRWPFVTTGYRVAVVRGMDSLATEWDKICSHFSEPTERFTWTKTAVEQLEHHTLVVTVSDSKDTMVAAAAFCDRGLLRHMTQPGIVDLYEPTDLLYQDPLALEALIWWVARKRLPIALYRVLADSPTLEAVRRAYRGKGLLRLSESGHCPYLLLNDGWSNPEDQVNSKLRSDLRRARRKAEHFGAIHFEAHAPRTAEAFKPLFDIALDVEDQGWKGKLGSSVLQDRVRHSFYEQYCRLAAEKGELRILFLRLGNVIAAMQLAVEYDSRLWLLKIGHNARFDECSPGMLLSSESISHAARNGLKSYEFLGESSPWTRRWTEQEHATMSLRVYPFSIRGFLLATASAIGQLKKLIGGKD